MPPAFEQLDGRADHMVRSLSPQALSELDRRALALWAADCAERVLPLFAREAPGDDRPRDAIARARAFGRGERDAAGEIRRRFVAGRAAANASAAAGVAAARSAAQAAGVAHMGAHALGAAAYAVEAMSIDTAGFSAEIEAQLVLLDGAAASALRRLPLLGENTSGPLGPGLLARGVRGETIRTIQARLRA